MIFCADVHDPKVCRKTLYKKSLRRFFGPYLVKRAVFLVRLKSFFSAFNKFWSGSSVTRCVPACVAMQKLVLCVPFFAQVVGQLWAADPSGCSKGCALKASSGAQSEAPR